MTFSDEERAELIAALSRTAEMVGLLLDAVRTKNRNDWSSETTTSTMIRGYSEWPASSIAATCTAFLEATADERSPP